MEHQLQHAQHVPTCKNIKPIVIQKTNKAQRRLAFSTIRARKNCTDSRERERGRRGKREREREQKKTRDLRLLQKKYLSPPPETEMLLRIEAASCSTPLFLNYIYITPKTCPVKTCWLLSGNLDHKKSGEKTSQNGSHKAPVGKASVEVYAPGNKQGDQDHQE